MGSSVRSYAVSLTYLAAILLTGCANQQPPDGGPPDRVPPEVLATNPSPGALRIREARLSVEFSKYMDERSVEESMFISPSVGTLEFNWSGRALDVRFSDTLRPRTTYVVSIGTDARDLQQQNRLARAFSCAFSTGDSLDRGAISGTVLSAQGIGRASGVMIFAYRLDGIDPDTLNPHRNTPDYISQTGTDGGFFLNHLVLGAYRLLAVRDEYRNLLYDPEVDEYGIPSTELRLTAADTLTEKIILKLAVEDTTGPRLTNAESVNTRHLLLEFSEPLDSSSCTIRSLAATDTESGKTLPLLAMYPSADKGNQFVVETERQDSNSAYRIRATVFDKAQNAILGSAAEFVFQGSGRKDSLPVRLSRINVVDSAVAVSLLPEVSVRFSNAVSLPSVRAAWSLREINGGEVPLSVTRSTDIQFEMSPVTPLMSVTRYALQYDGRRIRGIAGGASRDSVRTIRFETLDAELLSSLEGRVLSTKSGPGSLRVLAFNLAKKESAPLMTVCGVGNEFKFPDLEEGKYVLQVFLDQNENGKFDPGKPFPFLKSEPISVFSDTLKVRARWPLEGVLLRTW